VTVTESPGTGQARQLIQNGTFENDTVDSSQQRGACRHPEGTAARGDQDPVNLKNKAARLGERPLSAKPSRDHAQNGSSIVSVVAGRDMKSHIARNGSAAAVAEHRLTSNETNARRC
jgi:hypothetical protein